MQAPNAQGLAGLMSRPQQPQQQQPQGPTPDKASPMAGLGSVEDRVAAYRGNPAPLQQRYAMSQDLLDLLALQKIKSEKEAAVRDMQLKMGQQAAAQGDQAMTVAQQREKEVMDMTKAELARQRGATANQQVAEQQGAMQKLLSGIAQAPGAASAAQPVMMASGGIVAFDEGGYLSPLERYGKREAEKRARRAREIEEFNEQLRQDPAQVKIREAKAALEAMSPAERSSERGRRLREFIKNVFTSPPAAVVAAPTPAMVRPVDGFPAGQIDVGGETITPAAGSGRGDAINPPMADPSAAMPQPPAPAGLAGLPGAQGAPGLAPQPAAPAAPAAGNVPPDALGQMLRQRSMADMQIDPRARQLEEEGRIEGRLEFPEEKERRRRAIDEQRRMYEQEFDPERQRREGLKRALIGAGGRRYGEFAGAATAGMDYDETQRGAQRQRLKGLEDMEQGLFGLRKSAVESGIGAGQKAYEQSGTTQRQGMETGRGVYATETQSRDNALAREIDRLKVEAQNETNRISKEGLNLSRAQTLYSTTMNRMQQLERKLDEDFAGRYGMLLMAEQGGGKMDSAQRNQLDIAREELKMQKAALRQEMEPVLAPIRRQLGATSAVELSEEDQALVNEFLNKGK
jgi:hypothetical protein